LKKNCTVSTLFSTILLASSLLPQAGHAQDKPLTQYVNPYIGSQGHGHVFVGANVPYGAVQLGPSQTMQTWDQFNGWDWCSGYNYISEDILGFTHTHLSGTGIGDLNDLMIVPASGHVELQPAHRLDMNTGYGSNFKKASEVVKPGYYAVYLDKYKVKAELTATTRVGFHHYHYDNTDSAHLLIDLEFAMCWDAPVETTIKKVNDTTFVGYRFSKGWANDQRLFFAIKTSQPITQLNLYDLNNGVAGGAVKGKGVKAVMYFDAAKNADIYLKVGISPVSEENALGNIAAEIPGWNFEQVKTAADLAWNKDLNKIDFSADDATKTTFYTALYHSHFFPSVFNDHNGDYRGTDKKVYTNQKFTNYTGMSLWDTYRGLHPLMSVIDPSLVKDIVHSMLMIYQQQGRLPVWPLEGCETDCMIGNPAIPIITDAYLKGLIDPADVALAYEAVRNTAMRKVSGLQFVQELKYIPADSMTIESVAWGLEYAIADFGVAQMARKLGKTKDAAYFTKRAGLYKQYWDASEGHFVGRLANGSFKRPFDPLEAKHRSNDFCEGNGWQYTWLVPQDAKGLVNLFGEKKFQTTLDSFFNMSSSLGQGSSPDISGMVGQYAQGNEPSHHVSYLYAAVGRPWRTAEIVREVMAKYYTNAPDGLCGNEDAGQMSAWYVLSAMGFYPMNPMNGTFVFGSPLMDEAVIKLAGNKKFDIVVKDNSKENKYIQKIVLNGINYNKSFFLYKDIMKGGKMEIYMGSQPSATFGVKKTDRAI